jgi:Co/Zn/Cd efflux system component
MSGCCGGCGIEPGTGGRQRRTLSWVLGINAVMFVVMVVVALRAGSSALLSDSLDNLGDALTYALSLWAAGLGARAKARVALWKGGLILLAALGVAAHIVYRLQEPALPLSGMMAVFSLLALAANAVCLALLTRHRHEDINMASVWVCSRNDIAANLAVFAAAGGVWLTGSRWPDLIVALALMALFVKSGTAVVTDARRELAAAS